MGHGFLSDSWFDAVAELREKAGDLQLPDLIKNLQINIEVSGGPDGTIEARMDAGDFKRGFVDGAPTKLKLPFDVAKKMSYFTLSGASMHSLSMLTTSP